MPQEVKLIPGSNMLLLDDVRSHCQTCPECPRAIWSGMVVESQVPAIRAGQRVLFPFPGMFWRGHFNGVDIIILPMGSVLGHIDPEHVLN